MGRGSLRKWVGAVDRYQALYGKLPASVDALLTCPRPTPCSPVLSEKQLLYAFGARHLYAVAPDGRSFSITTLGADGPVGGEGSAADHTMTGG